MEEALLGRAPRDLFKKGASQGGGVDGRFGGLLPRSEQKGGAYEAGGKGRKKYSLRLEVPKDRIREKDRGVSHLFSQFRGGFQKGTTAKERVLRQDEGGEGGFSERGKKNKQDPQNGCATSTTERRKPRRLTHRRENKGES